MALEKHFQTEFNTWLRHQTRENKTEVFELKRPKRDRLLFSAIEEHQYTFLYNAKHHSVIFKIPDTALYQNPFDSVRIANANAYIVILFDTDHKKKTFYMIDIDKFIEHRDMCLEKSIKSIHEDEAKVIGEECILK